MRPPEGSLAEPWMAPVAASWARAVVMNRNSKDEMRMRKIQVEPRDIGIHLWSR
jgi:hypothetical protein